MPNLSLEAGYEFWKNEVDDLERPEAFVPYIPMVALVGIFVVSTVQKEQLTSYAWRQSVLRNRDAISGLRLSLPSMFRDEIDDTYEMPIDYFVPDNDAALQHKSAYASLMDGIPEQTNVVPENEWFLARNLGFADHDYAVALKPLRLSQRGGGMESIRNNYPRTAVLIEEHS